MALCARIAADSLDPDEPRPGKRIRHVVLSADADLRGGGAAWWAEYAGAADVVSGHRRARRDGLSDDAPQHCRPRAAHRDSDRDLRRGVDRFRPLAYRVDLDADSAGAGLRPDAADGAEQYDPANNR